MTALEHLEAIQKECLEHENDCIYCPCYEKGICVWKKAFNTAPYDWNLEPLKGVLYGY